MEIDAISKRWIGTFSRDRAVANLAYFRNSIGVEPIVLVSWYEGKAGGYVVAESGMRAWDITEPHLAPHGSPTSIKKDHHYTEMTGAEFEAAIASHPKDWYHNPPAKSFGTRVWEPFDEKRGIRDKEGFVYLHGVYTKPRKD